MTDPTMGEIAKAAENAAPGSIRVGDYLVTYIGRFPYADEKVELSDPLPNGRPASAGSHERNNE